MIHPADAHLVAQRSTNDKEKHLKIQTQIAYAETPIPTPPITLNPGEQIVPWIFWPKQFHSKSLPAKMFENVAEWLNTNP